MRWYKNYWMLLKIDQAYQSATPLSGNQNPYHAVLPQNYSRSELVTRGGRAHLCSDESRRRAIKGPAAAKLASSPVTSGVAVVLMVRSRWLRERGHQERGSIIFVCSEHNKSKIQPAVNFVLRRPLIQLLLFFKQKQIK
jgi:hypothetical protein